MDEETVSDIGELETIRRFTARVPALAGPPRGPGDDAALILDPGDIVVTTDLMVELRHFRLEAGWSSAFDVGYKLAAQNFADVAAMGARPSSLLVGIALPGNISVRDIEGIADGIATVCTSVGADVIGGDVVSSRELMLSGTAIGTLEGRSAVTRRGAQDGDVLVLAGEVGVSAAGLALLNRRFDTAGGHFDRLLERHRRPEPPYEVGTTLGQGGATAMTDVSDGLVTDVFDIAHASGVTIAIDPAMIPVADDIVTAGRVLDIDPTTWLLHGGEDHALVATIGTENVAALGNVVVPIGRVVSSSGIGVVDPTGTSLPRSGFDHFSSTRSDSSGP